jgi:hypothetical protein
MKNERNVAALGRLGLFMASLVPTLSLGCAGAYGHAPNYVAIDQEASVVAGAHEYDPSSVRSQGPDAWKKAVVLFGVVENRSAGPGGRALLKLSVRRLAPHNVCARAGDDDSCRVTVSESDAGSAWALVSLRGDDDVGPLAVAQRSLVRIVGTIGQDVSPADGAAVVHASWYRHWPANQYVSLSHGGGLGLVGTF